MIEITSSVLAIASMGFIGFNAVLFSSLQPKMVAWEEITAVEENLFLVTGFGLLVYIGFALTGFLHIANYLRRAPEIHKPYLLLVCGVVLSLLFVFADLALLSDIGKQYRQGWDQPEWLLLMPYSLAVGFWLLTQFHAKKLLWDEKQLQDIGKSSIATLLASTVILIALFFANYRDLGGITSMLWLPIQLFSVLFLFSLGNLYISWRV